MSRTGKKQRYLYPRHSLRGRLHSWYQDKGPVLRFGLIFGGLVAILYGILALPFFDKLLYSYLVANAWSANHILNALGQHTHVSDVVISSPQFSMAVRRGCDAVEPTWLFCAAVFAFPAPLREKLLGMGIGIVALQLLNLIRLVTLYWIGLHAPNLFNSAHMEIWPTVFILVAIVLFVFWKQWAFDRSAPHVK